MAIAKPKPNVTKKLRYIIGIYHIKYAQMVANIGNATVHTNMKYTNDIGENFPEGL